VYCCHPETEELDNPVASDEEFAEFAAGALPSLLRFAHVLTDDPSGAEDLVQTALGRCLRPWRLRQIDDPNAFVRKVMVNSYATWHRRNRRREMAVANPPDLIAEDSSGRVDDRDEICRALLSLPPRQRAVIVLRYYAELSEQEIAAAMGTSPGTVKSQASRALRRVTAVLASPRLAVPAANGDGVYVINANGTGLHKLTSGYDSYPVWSAANRIAFTRFLPHDSNGEIYVMNADGSGVTAITHGGRDFEQPAWSPSGRLIAFTATYGQPNYIVNADDTGLRELPGRWPKVQFLIQFAWGSAPLACPPGPAGCT
jgi:RNA polymerase sigma-70 factor (sigma-E family)